MIYEKTKVGFVIYFKKEFLGSKEEAEAFIKEMEALAKKKRRASQFDVDWHYYREDVDDENSAVN